MPGMPAGIGGRRTPCVTLPRAGAASLTCGASSIGDYIVLVASVLTLVSLFLPWFTSSVPRPHSEWAFTYSEVASVVVIVFFLATVFLVVVPGDCGSHRTSATSVRHTHRLSYGRYRASPAVRVPAGEVRVHSVPGHEPWLRHMAWRSFPLSFTSSARSSAGARAPCRRVQRGPYDT